MPAWRPLLLAATLAMGACDSHPPSEPGLPAPQLISGSVILPAGCEAGGTQPGQPAEPSLAADPTDVNRLAAAWLDSRSPDTVGVVVAITTDAGKHWIRHALPHLLACGGGSYLHASDPWISIGPDGVIYVSALARRAPTAAGSPYDIVVSVSRDHGVTWDPPVSLESETAPPRQPDKEAILADRRHPGTAYAVWADYQVTAGVEPSIDRITFARTADAGHTWSQPAAMYSGNDEAQQNQLFLTAGGILVDVFVEGSSLPAGAQPPPLPVKVRVMRSKDQGTTWSAPVDAATFTYTATTDPGSGKELRSSGQNIVAAASGNALYTAWFEDHADFSTILVARSDDAGTTWRAAQVVVREQAEAFLPALAVAGDGVLGMLWFDFRHYVEGRAALETDVWFSTSSDRGAHWAERHAAGPFDLRSAPASRLGPFIGDYMGLVGLPDGFAAVFVMARPRSRNGPTDVFFSHIAG
jgi:hypothetical protein